MENKSEDEASNLVTQECGEEGLIKRLLQIYPEFGKRDAWIAGTSKQENLKAYIKNTMLNEGWSY